MVKTTIQIDGMACGMCESHVSETIRKNFTVKSVKASHAKGIAEVVSKEPLDEAKLKAAMQPTGYEVKGMTSEPYAKKKLFGIF